MRASPGERHTASGWEIAPGAGRIAGVGMAGFRARSTEPLDLRAVPHPAVTLVLQFGDGSLALADTAGRQRHGSVVAGLDPGAVRMRGNDFACVEVRLSPVAAYAVLGIPGTELGSTVVTLDELWGREASRIRQRLDDARFWPERFAIANSMLAQRFERGPAVDPEVAWVWDQLVTSRGADRIDELAGEIGWSRRRLWGRFVSQIGVAPKRAAKLIRFDRAAHRLAAGESAARVAAEGGYADQSHLHRDVLAFTGMTPTALAADPGYVVHDLDYSNRRTFVQDSRR